MGTAEPHVSWANGITVDPTNVGKDSERVHQQLSYSLLSFPTFDGYTNLSELVAGRFALNAVTASSPPVLSPPFGHSLKAGF